MPNMLRSLGGDRALADQIIAEVEDSLWLAAHDAEVAAKVLDEAIKALEKEGWFSPSIEKIRDQIGESNG